MCGGICTYPSPIKTIPCSISKMARELWVTHEGGRCDSSHMEGAGLAAIQNWRRKMVDSNLERGELQLKKGWVSVNVHMHLEDYSFNPQYLQVRLEKTPVTKHGEWLDGPYSKLDSKYWTRWSNRRQFSTVLCSVTEHVLCIKKLLLFVSYFQTSQRHLVGHCEQSVDPQIQEVAP